MIGRYYEVTLQGSSVPIAVVVPIVDDPAVEQHDAIMFARNHAESWLRGRILRDCTRGRVVAVLDLADARDAG